MRYHGPAARHPGLLEVAGRRKGVDRRIHRARAHLPQGVRPALRRHPAQHHLLRVRRGDRHRDRGDQRGRRGRLSRAGTADRAHPEARPGAHPEAPPEVVGQVAGTGRCAGVFLDRRPEAARPGRQAGARLLRGSAVPHQADHPLGDRPPLPRARHRVVLQPERREPPRRRADPRHRARRPRVLPGRPRQDPGQGPAAAARPVRAREGGGRDGHRPGRSDRQRRDARRQPGPAAPCRGPPVLGRGPAPPVDPAAAGAPGRRRARRRAMAEAIAGATRSCTAPARCRATRRSRSTS